MSCLCLRWLAVFCGTAGFCSALAAESFREIPVTVSLSQWCTRKFHLKASPFVKKELFIHLDVYAPSPWKVAYCEEEKASIRIRDARGRMSPRLKCRYSPFAPLPGMSKSGGVSMSTDSWSPSPEAAWFDMKGKVPLVVSRTFSTSEYMALKRLNGNSAALTLKGAAMGGGNVEVLLEVKEEKREQDAWEEKRQVILSLVSPVRIGFLGFGLRSEDGTEMPEYTSERTMWRSGKKYEWKRYLDPDSLSRTEWEVSVNYAAGLKETAVPVNIRCSLAGVGEKGEGEQKEG